MAINTQEQLNKLFFSWKEKHKAKGYENFIRDGIIDYDAWGNQTTPKVCYFLKEAYIKDKPFEALESLPFRFGEYGKIKFRFGRKAFMTLKNRLRLLSLK